MKLALQLAWEHRARWVAMLVLTAVSGAVLMLGLHSAIGYELAMELQHLEASSPALDVIISVAATFLIVQSIAALCLESQARDLAVIKTCGASTKALRRTLAGEVFIVTSLGFVLGLAAAVFVIDPYVSGIVWEQSEFRIPPIGLHGDAAINAYVILLIAVFVGAWSTLKNVSRQNVVSALQGDSVTTHKRSKVLRWIVAVLCLLVMGGLFVLMQYLDVLITQFKSAPKDIQAQLLGLPMLSGVIFCLLALTFLVTVAPNLYQAILGAITRRLPQRAPAGLQVGFNLARYNAAKYSGSITPIIAFITVVIMIFTAMDASTAMIFTQLESMGVDTSIMEGTNYSGIAYIIGPAVLIAVTGSLCTIVMSGRNRIYVNKLAGIIGADKRERLKLALLEMAGYISLAAIISCGIMLLTAALVMLGNTRASGIQQEFMPSWGWWFVAVVVSFLFMLGPAIYAVRRANRLESKAVLETFGE